MSDPYRHMSNQDLESHGREWADLPMFPAESIPNPEGYPGCLGLRFGPAHLSRKLAGIDCQHT
ncbi:hypothetical protein [Microbacterium sp.]|uniref:hypothetical protein n=1 Tax=Microbacterium sp. TaxID=51671 RepID=UPI00257BB750|nr:hypothetical protein [Microbacterium sp.]|tara:strand:- start:674 stop:862 length:189 start_codon:yes stop_codon:yes gene_type:complete